jgi:hypothetical protein
VLPPKWSTAPDSSASAVPASRLAA